MATADAGIPVTTIGGYLGAGKTTLVNNLLSGEHGLRIAVVVNDFGAISIDEKLITSRDGEIISLANGCACCSIAGDLAEVLDRLARLAIRPDHILVEASGVANPSRVAALAGSPGLETRKTIVVADAETVETHASDKFIGRLVRDQIALAGLIILNKIDLVDTLRLEATRSWMRAIAPDARLVETVQSVIPLDILFDTARGTAVGPLPGDFNETTDRPFESFCWSSPDRVDLDALREVVRRLPSTIVRAKGVILAADQAAGTFVMQLVGRRWTIEPARSVSDAIRSEIVLISVGASLDERRLREAFDECVVRANGIKKYD